MPDRVEIRVLGGFGVAVDGVELAPHEWPSLRSAHLVQLLSLADGHALAREQVIEALWPHLEPAAGGANLRKAAHHARQALRTPEAVVLHAGQVRLGAGAATVVDALHFERLAQEALARKDAQACAAAAQAYGGELLPEARYESWSQERREQLRALHLALLRASAQWERLAQLDPTDEPAHRELMRRELAAGNRASAMRWYARLRQALQEELAVAPDGETEALYEQCLAGLQAPGPLFVGRQREVAQAGAWLRAAPGARPGGVVIRGPAGIGKTTFCRQLGSMARAQGWRVLGVDAALPDRPYAMIAAVVDRLILESKALLEALEAPARSVLATLTPLAGPAPALPGPPGRHQVIGAFRRLLLAAAPGGNVVVCVDDAQWMDEADVDALLHLAMSGQPVLVVLAMRPAAAESALTRGVARLTSAGSLLPIELGPLAADDLVDVVERTAARALTAELVRHIVRQAEGNPFAAIELARCAGANLASRLPADTAAAITARLCDVSDGALSLLKYLALLGSEFDAATVSTISPVGEDETFAQLDEALRAGVLVAAEGRYGFRHELVRQALVDQTAPHQRLKWHRQAARQLAQTQAPPAVVAQHWLAAGHAAEALPWWLQAAEQAVRLAAFHDALRYLEPVLAFAREHAQALRLRAEALDALGDPAAVAAYRAAAAVAEPALADDLRAKGALAQIKQGDPKGALQALAGLQPATVEGRLSEALAYCGAAAMGVTDPAIGSAKAAEARRLALQAGDQSALVVASWAQAAAAHARGELHQSLWADLHETRHMPHLAMRVFDGQLCMAQRFLYGGRPYPEVIAFAEALAAQGQRLGAARGHAFGMTLRGEAELLAGDLQAAEEHLTLGARLHHAIGGATGEAFSLQRLAEVALQRGRREEARALLDRALDLARQTDVGFHLLDRIYGTRVALSEDPMAALHALADAREAVRGPLETCPGCRITFAVPAAIAAARAGRLDWAAEHEGAAAYLAHVVMRLPAWYAALEEVRAHLAQARGEAADAVSARFNAAASQFRAAGHPLDAVRCEALAAQAGR